MSDKHLDLSRLNEAERYVQYGFGEGWRARVYSASDVMAAFRSGRNAAEGVPYRLAASALAFAGLVGVVVGSLL